MLNKKRADWILVILLFSFLLVILVRRFLLDNYVIDMLGFTIEAALVGGIADWFAVTALFREPLGFSWHTAIIPKNRERVIDSVAKVVENELLGPDVIRGKVEKLEVMDKVILYIEEKNIKAVGVGIIKKYGPDILSKLDKGKIALYIEDLIKRNAAKIDLSLEIRRFFDWFTGSDDYERLMTSIQEELIAIVKRDSTKEEICSIINSEIRNTINAATGLKRMLMEMALSVAEGTNSINVPDAAASLQEELAEVLGGLKDENNVLHIRLKAIIDDFIQKISSDRELISSMETWKSMLIEKIELKSELEKHIGRTIDELKTLLYELDEQTGVNIVAKSSPAICSIISWGFEQIDKYWNSFKHNDSLKKSLEGYIKKKLSEIINAEHHLLGKMVKTVLHTFTDETLNEFIEKKAGNDLHWIRINGSIVGAVFGLILYLFINLFYGPVVVPFIQNLI